jgi:hypothetical protein
MDNSTITDKFLHWVPGGRNLPKVRRIFFAELNSSRARWVMSGGSLSKTVSVICIEILPDLLTD